MIRCEECIQDPIPHCSVCEELLWLHQFRLKSQNQEEEEWLTHEPESYHIHSDGEEE